jgi:hypothetical protein
MKTKAELLRADAEYRTIIAMQHGKRDAVDHSPNDEEVAGSMIRSYGDQATWQWLQEEGAIRERFPRVENLLRYALDPKNYE